MARPRTFERDEALERAMVTFWKQGFEATSVQDLVDRMGINRGSLYDTFGSKRALFLAAIDRYLEVVVAERVAALEDAGSGKEAIGDFFSGLVAFSLNEGRLLGCLMTNSALEMAPRDPETAARVAANLSRMETAFHGALCRAKARGEVPADRDPRALARFLTNAVQGLRVLSRTAPDEAVLRDVVKVTLKTLE